MSEKEMDKNRIEPIIDVELEQVAGGAGGYTYVFHKWNYIYSDTAKKYKYIVEEDVATNDPHALVRTNLEVFCEPSPGTIGTTSTRSFGTKQMETRALQAYYESFGGQIG